MKKCISFRENFLFHWCEFNAVLRTFHRYDDLRRLVIWARRKNLSRPLRLYKNRLLDEEIRLNRYCIKHPRMTVLASTVYRLNTLLLSTPHYYPRGSAAVYRVKNLTTGINKTYSYL
jgi:hypothetical protein